MLNDIRLGFRTFRRHAGALDSAAVLSLALGIGANTAIFSVLHSVVLNALPYDDPDRLVIVWETSARQRRSAGSRRQISWTGGASRARLRRSPPSTSSRRH